MPRRALSREELLAWLSNHQDEVQLVETDGLVHWFVVDCGNGSGQDWESALREAHRVHTARLERQRFEPELAEWVRKHNAHFVYDRDGMVCCLDRKQGRKFVGYTVRGTVEAAVMADHGKRYSK